MQTETIALAGSTPGIRYELTVHRFGRTGARPQVYVQGGLHADEGPGMLAAHALREKLCELEQAERIAGEVILVPAANPIGLAQRVLGTHLGRFDLADGANFNRHFPQLGPKAAALVEGRLGPDAQANVALVRASLRTVLEAELADQPVQSPARHLKHTLIDLALDADVVLDLHCDSEAVVHLYTLTPQAEVFAPLSAYLGARAVLLANESGDHPFDEALSGPWLQIRERFPQHPVPLACAAATVELRGEADVTSAFSQQDAGALLDYLVHLGAVTGNARELPASACLPTPLAGSEPIMAPVSGVVAFRREVGETVRPGEIVADIVDPVTGISTPVPSTTTGVFYARASVRVVAAGKRLGKIAGSEPRRSGKLLSP